MEGKDINQNVFSIPSHEAWLLKILALRSNESFVNGMRAWKDKKIPRPSRLPVRHSWRSRVKKRWNGKHSYLRFKYYLNVVKIGANFSFRQMNLCQWVRDPWYYRQITKIFNSCVKNFIIINVIKLFIFSGVKKERRKKILEILSAYLSFFASILYKNLYEDVKEFCKDLNFLIEMISRDCEIRYAN